MIAEVILMFNVTGLPSDNNFVGYFPDCEVAIEWLEDNYPKFDNAICGLEKNVLPLQEEKKTFNIDTGEFE